MPNSVRKQLTGRGPLGKTAVMGARDRATNQGAAKAVPATDKQTGKRPSTRTRRVPTRRCRSSMSP